MLMPVYILDIKFIWDYLGTCNNKMGSKSF